jgi:hypothetical protein
VPDVNAPAFPDRLARSGAELILTFHFDQILKAETIGSVAAGGINVHPGLLPKHRGPVPTIHALLDDPVELGVSIHRLAPKIDAGALIARCDAGRARPLGASGSRAPARGGVARTGTGARRHRGGRAREEPLPTLPYRGFPTPAEMRRLAGKGRHAAGWRDLAAALRAARLTCGSGLRAPS